MKDIIENLDTKAVIQHGKLNDRIYLMDLGNCYVNKTIKQLNRIAKENKYGKVFAKVPAWAKERFEKNGYESEARIPKFYNGETAVHFMAKYFSADRKKNIDSKKTKEIVKLAKSKKNSDAPAELPKSYKLQMLKEEDAEQAAELYGKVFESYPFPIDSAKYIKKTMKDNFYYFGIKNRKSLISVASSETDMICGNVEMTDFATDPKYLGKNLSYFLLDRMEEEMVKLKIYTWYTLARSLSPGMNITFAKKGYKFAGTLVNNTNICGNIENMNVWYKYIPKKKRKRAWSSLFE